MDHCIGGLPADLIRHLLEYLNEEDHIQLLDCAKRFWCLKKAVRKVTLNEERLERCCEDEKFLAKLMSLIEEPGRQIKIVFDGAKEWNYQTFPFRGILCWEQVNFSILKKLSLAAGMILTIQTVVSSANEEGERCLPGSTEEVQKGPK